MKKLTAILRDRNFTDKLFGLREKQIKTALTAARNDIEEQRTKAEIDLEGLYKKLGDKEVTNYKDIFNKMITCKDTISNSKKTLTILDEIEKELDTEVEIEDSAKSE